MEILHYLLTKIRIAPSMYLGIKSLTNLALFLSGAAGAMAVMTGNLASYAPHGFEQFVFDRFPTQDSINIFTNILRNTANEEEALDKFYELLDEFLASKGMTYIMPEDTKGDILGLYTADGQPHEPQ